MQVRGLPWQLMDNNALLIMMSLLIVKHFVLDWYLQGPYQFLNKGTYGHPGGILHAGGAALGTLISLLAWTVYEVPLHHLGLCTLLVLTSSKIWLVLLAEFVFHYHLDWAKVKITKYFALDMTKDAAYWDLVGLDQMLHYLSYVVILAVLFSN